MGQSELQEISEKIDAVVRLLAVSVTAGKKRTEKLVLLSQAGFQPKKIAELLGTTPNSVRVELSRLRKRV